MAHLSPRRPSRRQPRRQSSGTWLTLTLGAGFAATLAALQLQPVDRASASADGVPVRVMAGPAADQGFAMAGAPVGDAGYTAAGDALRARFSFCHGGGGANCVVDGDTFWFGGEKIRIMDIDTPETHPARCADEQRLGDAATARLQDWLNAGAFSVEDHGRSADRYGRQLRVITRAGTSVGNVLISEGLARPWDGMRRPWC